MKVIRKILSIIFNPLNSISYGNANDKAAYVFGKNAILVFIISLLVTGIIFVITYFI